MHMGRPHAGQHCAQDPCRRNYTDYSTYLKNRKCVTPSDLCTLKYEIQHGKIKFGCISQSGDTVEIDCNLYVHAPEFIKLEGPQITELASEYIEMKTGPGACGVSTVPNVPDIRLDAGGSLEAWAGDYVDIQAGGCEGCPTNAGVLGEGDIRLGAGTRAGNIQGAAPGGAVVLEAGCPSECPIWPDPPGTGDIVAWGKNDVRVGSQTGSVAISSGCGLCSLSGLSAGDLSLQAERRLTCGAQESIKLLVGTTCEGPCGGGGSPDPCAPCVPAGAEDAADIFVGASGPVAVASKEWIALEAGCGGCSGSRFKANNIGQSGSNLSLDAAGNLLAVGASGGAVFAGCSGLACATSPIADGELRVSGAQALNAYAGYETSPGRMFLGTTCCKQTEGAGGDITISAANAVRLHADCGLPDVHTDGAAGGGRSVSLGAADSLYGRANSGHVDWSSGAGSSAAVTMTAGDARLNGAGTSWILGQGGVGVLAGAQSGAPDAFKSPGPGTVVLSAGSSGGNLLGTANQGLVALGAGYTGQGGAFNEAYEGIGGLIAGNKEGVCTWSSSTTRMFAGSGMNVDTLTAKIAHCSPGFLSNSKQPDIGIVAAGNYGQLTGTVGVWASGDLVMGADGNVCTRGSGTYDLTARNVHITATGPASDALRLQATAGGLSMYCKKSGEWTSDGSLSLSGASGIHLHSTGGPIDLSGVSGEWDVTHGITLQAGASGIHVVSSGGPVSLSGASGEWTAAHGISLQAGASGIHIGSDGGPIDFSGANGTWDVVHGLTLQAGSSGIYIESQDGTVNLSGANGSWQGSHGLTLHAGASGIHLESEGGPIDLSARSGEWKATQGITLQAGASGIHLGAREGPISFSGASGEWEASQGLTIHAGAMGVHMGSVGGPIDLSGTSGRWTAGADITLQAGASGVISLSGENGEWTAAEGITLSAGASGMHLVSEGRIRLDSSNEAVILSGRDISATCTGLLSFGSNTGQWHTTDGLTFSSGQTVALSGHTGTWNATEMLELNTKNLVARASGYANIHASHSLHVESHTINLKAHQPGLDNTAVNVEAGLSGVSLSSDGHVSIGAPDVHISPTGSSGYVYVGPVARTHASSTQTSLPALSPAHPTVYETLTQWLVESPLLAATGSNAFSRMYNIGGNPATLASGSFVFTPSDVSRGVTGMQITILNAQTSDGSGQPDPLSERRVVRWSERIQGVSGTSGYIHLYGGGNCTLTNLGSSWLCTSAAPATSYKTTTNVWGVYPLAIVSPTGTAPDIYNYSP